MPDDKWNMAHACYGIYFKLQSNEISRNATTWMTLEDIILSEINQPQKHKYYIIPLRWDTQSDQIQRHRAEWWLPGAGDQENGEVAKQHEVSVVEDEKVLEMDSGDSYTMWAYVCHWTGHIKMVNFIWVFYHIQKNAHLNMGLLISLFIIIASNIGPSRTTNSIIRCIRASKFLQQQ